MAHLSRVLRELASIDGCSVVVASHSPELLDDRDAHVYYVRRLDQGTVDGKHVLPLDSPDLDRLEELGLHASDLLRYQRGFLLVEGQHEVAVLSAMMGDRLRKLRVELLPMRGGSKLKASIDTRVLFDHTDAHVFAILDAIPAHQLTSAWEDALSLAKTQSMQVAIDHIRESLKSIKADEAGWMTGFLTRALETHRQSRVTPYSLPNPDVLYYLPVDAFVPGATSWEDLRDELERDRQQPASGRLFKDWLRTAKSADLSTENIERVAREVDSTPQDLEHLMQTIEQVFSGERVSA